MIFSTSRESGDNIRDMHYQKVYLRRHKLKTYANGGWRLHKNVTKNEHNFDFFIPIYRTITTYKRRNVVCLQKIA